VSALSARPEPAKGLASIIAHAFRTGAREIWCSIWPNEKNSWLVLAELNSHSYGWRYVAPILCVGCFGIAEAFDGYASVRARWTWAFTATAVIMAAYLAERYYGRRAIRTLAQIRAGALRQSVLLAIISVAWCSVGAALWSPHAPLNHVLLSLLLAVASSAELHLPHWNMLDVIFFGHGRTARFQHERLQAFLREFLRGPASGHAGTNHDCIVARFFLHWRAGPPMAGSSAHPSCRSGMISKCNSAVAPASEV